MTNLMNILDIQPQYLRHFTLMNCVKVIDEFYVQDQKNQLGLAAKNGPIPYEQQIPASLIDTSTQFKTILLSLYSYNLSEIKFLMQDSKIYVERHFLES